MKRFLLIPFVLLCASCAWGQITAVGGTSARVTSGTTLALTYTPTAGNILVVICGATVACSAVADNASGGSATYTKQVQEVVAAKSIVLFTATAKSGTTTITITQNAGIGAGAVEEYSGVVSIGSTAGNAATSATQTITMSSAASNDFIVAGFAASNTGYSSNTGNLRQSTSVGTANVNVALNDNTAASPSSITNIVTASSSSAYNAVAIDLKTTASSNAAFQVGAFEVGP